MNFVLTFLGVLSAIVLTAFVLIESLHKLNDLIAIQAIKRYCKQEKIIFGKVHALPSSYAFYFQKEGKNYYTGFSFKKGNIVWKDGDPLEKIKKKETIRSLKLANKNKLRLEGNPSY